MHSSTPTSSGRRVALPPRTQAAGRAVARVALPCLFVALTLPACGMDESVAQAAGEFAYENQIFSDTYTIAAAQSGTETTPNFSWPATAVKHVVCAVFAERIAVTDNLIANPEAVVWIWHSGLGQGRDGNVLYDDGVIDLETRAAPGPLPSGTYYWAVWAMDDGGNPVASSIEYTLTVP